MKIFLDSDVLIDLLTAREPFIDEIKWIVEYALSNKISLYTSSLILANIHYLIGRIHNSQTASAKIDEILSFTSILGIGEIEIRKSLKSKFKDFEDGIQNFCAINSNMDIIVTRNVKDFKLSTLPVLTPKELISRIDGSSGPNTG